MGSDYIPGPTPGTTAQDVSPREIFALDFSGFIVRQQLVNRKKGKISDTLFLKGLPLNAVLLPNAPSLKKKGIYLAYGMQLI